jgi:hypothetical protein
MVKTSWRLFENLTQICLVLACFLYLNVQNSDVHCTVMIRIPDCPFFEQSGICMPGSTRGLVLEWSTSLDHCIIEKGHKKKIIYNKMV